MTTDCGSLADADAKQRAAFRRRLLAWYARHKRDLPWRKSSNPYRVWLSEVMLQQTQVATVKDYFQRFVEALPTVEALAEADESDVLRLWEGLGYYRRARSLHAAAKQVVAKHDGEFPGDVNTLMQLPGVGRYTAGAVASIAFDKRAPILEANTIRLFCRLIGHREPPSTAASQRLLWQLAGEILPRKNIARFNQALMELGSLVCTPVEPHCDCCPVIGHCAAAREGVQSEVPASTAKPKFEFVREAAVVVGKNGSVLLRKCAAGERWAGLWDFPRFEVELEGPLFEQEELAQKVETQTGISISSPVLLKTIKHGVTRFRISLDCYRADFEAGRVRSTAERTVAWTARTRLEDLPMSTTGRKIARLIS